MPQSGSYVDLPTGAAIQDEIGVDSRADPGALA